MGDFASLMNTAKSIMKLANISDDEIVSIYFETSGITLSGDRSRAFRTGKIYLNNGTHYVIWNDGRFELWEK